MIEVRELNKTELITLLEEAPVTETSNLNRIIKDPYEFFQRWALQQKGIVIDKRPIYFGAVTFSRNKEIFQLWTVVNKNVKHQFSLYKIAKRIAHEWAKVYGRIYATMEKTLTKNIEWTKRLGFIPVEENERIITLKLEGV